MLKYVILFLLLLVANSVHPTERSSAAKRAFVKEHACPSTHKNELPCPGHVIDHKKSLDCGGKDEPENMQWQTIAEAKEKDKWERNGKNCKHRTHGVRKHT